MKSASYTLIQLIITVLFLINISGCVEGRRFYFSEPLPADQVSLFITKDYKTTIHSIGEAGKPIKNFAGLDMGEILPGNYTLCVAYVYIGTYKNEYSHGCVNLDLNALPGHVYYIFPMVTKNNLWQPGIVDISHDEDYQKIEGGDQIHKRVITYFQKERRVITQSEAGKHYNVWE